MHSEHLDQRLSEYLDHGLDAAEAAACERHLETCAECRALLADLEGIRAAALVLPAPPPARDLWSGIEARIAAKVPGAELPAAIVPESQSEPGARVLRLDTHPRWWQRRLTFALPQVAAAAVILVVIAGGGTWLALRSQPTRLVAGLEPAPQSPRFGVTPFWKFPTPSTPSGEEAGAARVQTTGPDAVLASVDPRYDDTIAELQSVLTQESGRLDTSTVRILQQNLALIDRAVAEARRAVERDPSNAYLRSHLAATMRRKVTLLRRATVIPGAQG